MKILVRKALFATIPFIAICFVFVCPAQAAEFCVNDTAGLQAALTQAASNGEDDIIRIVQGTYLGNFVYASFEANALTIEGGYATGCASRTIEAANTVLNGNGTGSVLVISTDTATSAKIEGLTFQNGVASNGKGGGLYFKTSGGNLEMDGCVFAGNSADSGGAVYAHAEYESLTLTITNNTFIGNNGRGVYALADGGTLTFTNNTFTGNNGGGLYALVSEGTVTLTKNIFSGNSAGYGGGVLFSGSSSISTLIVTLTLTDNSFIGNSASRSGGGLYATGPTVTLTGNSFRENSASFGGGVYAYWKDYGKLVAFTGNIIHGNSAESGGGGVYAGADSVSLTNNIVNGNSSGTCCGGVLVDTKDAVFTGNVVTNNSAGASGGGVSINTEVAKITNNTIIGNSSAVFGGGGVYLAFEDNASIYNNIIWDNNCEREAADIYIDNDVNGDFLPSPINLFNNEFDQSAAGTYIKIPFSIDPSNLNKADPLFVDAENGDLHLSAGSPCIDKGNNAAPELPATDKDGNPRICDGTVDMGAYEFTVFNVEPSGKCGGKTPCYPKIQAAIDALFGTGMIRISTGANSETPTVNTEGKKVTLEGGWDTSFQSRTGGTILRHAPRAEKGSLTLQNLAIRPE